MIKKQTTLDLNGPILSFTQQPSSVTIDSGDSTTFVGVATVSYPTQDPVNPAVNTGSIAYQWYVEGYGALSDGYNFSLGMEISGSSTTTLSISDVIGINADGRRFYLIADVIPSAYSQPTGTPVTVGTARSTGNAFNQPKSSDVVTLTVRTTISVTSNPSNQRVSIGDFATFTASGSSDDGSAVLIRWILNGSYLSDNGSTIFGSNTNTLRISLPNESSNVISAEISNPRADNSPIPTNTASFIVVNPRELINYEYFRDDLSTLGSTGSIDLSEQPGNYINFTAPSSLSIYAPEKDVAVRITLAGSGGGTNSVYRGGCGGVNVIDLTLQKNVEYVLKIGSYANSFTSNSDPSGGWPYGGGASILYRKAKVIAVSGGGGSSGSDGRGGDGGAAGQAGGNGQALTPGTGGRAVPTGALGTNGYGPSGLTGGKLSSCTIGDYWRTIGFSPCQDLGEVPLYDSFGRIIENSAEIQRGYKSGDIDIRTNGGTSSDLTRTNGAGGGGAYGGNASSGNSQGYRAGGGGGSGYWSGDGTLRLAVRGGNCSTQGYVRIDLLTANTPLPSISPPPPDLRPPVPPPLTCREEGELDLAYFIDSLGDPTGIVLGLNAVNRARSCGFSDDEIVSLAIRQGKKFGTDAQQSLNCRNEYASTCDPGGPPPPAVCRVEGERNLAYFIDSLGDPSGIVLGLSAVNRARSCGFSDCEIVSLARSQGKRFGASARSSLNCRNEYPWSCSPSGC